MWLTLPYSLADRWVQSFSNCASQHLGALWDPARRQEATHPQARSLWRLFWALQSEGSECLIWQKNVTSSFRRETRSDILMPSKAQGNPWIFFHQIGLGGLGLCRTQKSIVPLASRVSKRLAMISLPVTWGLVHLERNEKEVVASKSLGTTSLMDMIILYFLTATVLFQLQWDQYLWSQLPASVREKWSTQKSLYPSSPSHSRTWSHKFRRYFLQPSAL